MSRRIRVNLTRWVCKTFGHRWLYYGQGRGYCDRCGRFW